MNASGPSRRWVPWGPAERSADPERTTTPVQSVISRMLIIGAIAFVIAYYVLVNAGRPTQTPVSPTQAPQPAPTVAPSQPAPMPPLTYP